jgi:hypothetical protein
LIDVSSTNPCEELLGNSTEFADCRASRKVDFNSLISRCVDATRADEKRNPLAYCSVVTAVMRLCAVADASLRVNPLANTQLMACRKLFC